IPMAPMSAAVTPISIAPRGAIAPGGMGKAAATLPGVVRAVSPRGRYDSRRRAWPLEHLNMLNIVHVTHEAVVKIGGIGTVLEGLITSSGYGDAVGRTLLVCPLFSTEGNADSRLGPGGEVLYSSIDGRWGDPHHAAFGEIQAQFHVEIVYGRRHLRDPISGREAWPEVVLIDIGR